ncbi:hypothetical protein N177_4098 [Lutibaculum baratangense AMV1]|uniref:Uncharacterized protein n=1 Tax=Lutibaculum baratangense AMV1 TaxID=631454 RepID=V4T7D3_9HYPH|nr:hypothetical protein N177_4098 [Lutibaculum baratangense AMV1]
MAGIGGPVGRPGSTEHIGDLERGAQRTQPPGVASSGMNIASLSSGLVTLRTVRVAALV